MVKNDLSNSTHSLRGTSSTLSLRQAAVTNRELEQARRTIKELEEQNKKLEQENVDAKKRSADKATLGAAVNALAGPTGAPPRSLIDMQQTQSKSDIDQLLKASARFPPPPQKPHHTNDLKTFHGNQAVSDFIHMSDANGINSLGGPQAAGTNVTSMPTTSLFTPTLDYSSATPATYHPYNQSTWYSTYYGPYGPVIKAQPAASKDQQIPGMVYRKANGELHSRSLKATDVKEGQSSTGYGPVPPLLAVQGSYGDIYGRPNIPTPNNTKSASTNVNNSPSDGKSLFEKYMEDVESTGGRSGKSLIADTLSMPRVQKEVDNSLKDPEAYAQPFCEFLTENPTVWHAVNYFEKKLEKAGFQKLSERKTWNDILATGGKYYISRNGSSLIAFSVGSKYKSGNGVAMVAGHVDALTARLKPISNKKTSAGYVQLGVAPYAGALNSTWWDRDLGIGGRVLVKDEKTGKITTKLVKLGWPIARIPTLAPHFGIGMTGQENKETQTVPIIGLDTDSASSTEEFANLTLGAAGTFAATQPPKLVRAIAGELSINDYSSIVNWELELYDTQPAQTGGLEKEFIFGGRIDDKVCSWAAMEGLLAASSNPAEDDGLIKLVGVFDDEEIGSLLRQGAKGNLLPSVIERITESFAPSGTLSGANLLSQTYANSFLISADVTHAVNPNFLGSYLENHAPRLNVGLCVCADSNGHMTTDSVSTALLTRIAEKSDNKLQLFMIRNDSRSGGTVGPMLSSAMGVRAIDAGIPQLSMHSIRATIGNLDPGLGVKIFAGFFENFESVDREFE